MPKRSSLKRKIVRDRQVAYSKDTIRDLSYSDPILYGIAKGPWALHWAEQQEEQGRTFPGEDLYEICPPPPSDAVRWAEDVAAQLVKMNDVKTLEDLMMIAVENGFAKDEEDFGAYLGCEAAGHGVTWHDDLDCGSIIKIPDREFYV
jgi:hypothetical protein